MYLASVRVADELLKSLCSLAMLLPSAEDDLAPMVTSMLVHVCIDLPYAFFSCKPTVQDHLRLMSMGWTQYCPNHQVALYVCLLTKWGSHAGITY